MWVLYRFANEAVSLDYRDSICEVAALLSPQIRLVDLCFADVTTRAALPQNS